MAVLITCDGGCGKHSPDFAQRSPHIANYWEKVQLLGSDIAKRNKDAEPQMFCQDCWPDVAKALGVRP